MTVDIPPTDRLGSLQAARGLAATMVVAFHALFIERKYMPDSALLPDFFGFGLTGVDLFFVISGFVMVLTTQGRHGDAREVRRFLWHRFARIYPTYWFYFFILLAVYLVAPNLVGASQGHRFDLVSSFLLLPDEGLPLLLVAWSLVHELWFYIVFALLLALPARLLTAGLAVWAAVIVAANLALPPPENPFLRVGLHAFTLEFIAGCVCGLIYRSAGFRRLSPATATTMLLCGIVLVVAAHHYQLADGSDVIQSIPLARVLVLGPGFGLLVLGLAGLEPRTRFFELPPVRLAGDMSYSLYLSHVLVLSAAGRIAAMTLGPGAPTGVLVPVWIAIAVVVCVSAYLSWRLVERPLHRLTKRLGQRVLAEPVAA